MTIDEAIKRLQQARQILGGDAEFRHRSADQFTDTSPIAKMKVNTRINAAITCESKEG